MIKISSKRYSYYWYMVNFNWQDFMGWNRYINGL